MEERLKAVDTLDMFHLQSRKENCSRQAISWSL